MARTARCRWFARNGRRASRGARPSRPDTPKPRRVRIRVQPASPAPGRAAGWDGYGGGPGCWSSRPREHKLVARQRFALPPAGIEIENAPGLQGEVRVAREDPPAVLPGADGILVSQRHTVLPLMVATSPLRCASRAMSAQLKRDRGTPRVAGSSHAMALTSTTTSGGKNPGAARARAFFEAGQSFLRRNACATG